MEDGVVGVVSSSQVVGVCVNVGSACSVAFARSLFVELCVIGHGERVDVRQWAVFLSVAPGGHGSRWISECEVELAGAAQVRDVLHGSTRSVTREPLGRTVDEQVGAFEAAVAE
ncbi:MAG: hypothetical protein RI554_00960 [Trueperaceae bacterium]|nr:hypothetical protein [Trueperaceae bacterium]